MLHNTTYIATAPAGRAGLTYLFRHCAPQCHPPAVIGMARDKRAPKGTQHGLKLEVGDRMNWKPVVVRDSAQQVTQVTEVLPYDGIVATKSVVKSDAPPTHIGTEAPSG